MNRKLLGFLCVLGVFLAVLVSCESDPEEKRSVITVAAINENAPFFSDVVEQGDSVYRVLPDGSTQPVLYDDYIREDFISVLFYNRPYSIIAFTAPGAPYGEYRVTRYRVEWVRTDGGTQVPPTYNGATSVSIPTGEYVEASIVLVPYEVKLLPFINDLCYICPNRNDEILCIANITFWGHEVGTDRETMFTASISVNFADWVVKSKKEY